MSSAAPPSLVAGHRNAMACFGHGGLGLSRLEAMDQHRCAFFCEAPGNDQAGAPVAATHQGRSAVESQIHGLHPMFASGVTVAGLSENSHPMLTLCTLALSSTVM